MEPTSLAPQENETAPPKEFHRALGLFDSVMVVAGIMVGSGIFIVSAEKHLGAGGQRRLAAGGLGHHRYIYLRRRACVW